jgi:hypothetical protein
LADRIRNDSKAARRPSSPSASSIDRRPAKAEPLFQANGFSISSWLNVMVIVWTTPSSIELVENLSRCSTQFHASHPEGVSVVHVIAKGPPLPQPEVREKFSELLGKNPKTLACVGVVLEGRGFWASAIRSFLLGLRVLSPRSVQMQAFSTAGEVATWLVVPHEQRTGLRLDARDLEKILEGARAAVER